MSKLEVALLVGPESKAFLANLTEQLDRMEQLAAGQKITGPKTIAAVDVDEDDDFTPAPKKKAAAKKASAGFDQDDEDVEPAPKYAEETEVEEDEDFTAPPKKAAKAKAKKITLDDVNDACKARAAATGGKKGREEVLGILKKKFKTTSVSELEPEQYAAAIKAMEA